MCLVSETYTNCVCFKMYNFSYFQCKSRGHGFGSDYPSSWSMATYMHILFKGIQRGFSGQGFRILELKLFGFVVAIFDLVHDVEAIHDLC